MKSILVTGSNGQLGVTFKDLANSQMGNDFIFTFVSREELDITKVDEINRFMLNNNFDYCINCAAYTNVELAESEKLKAFDVNADGPKNLAIFCKKYGTTLIQISTDYVFDGEVKGAYSEEDSVNPINIYGETKLKGEGYIRQLMEDYYIIRTSWLYSQHGKNFFNSIITKLESGEHMRVVTNEISSPTSTYVLARAILHMIMVDPKEYGVYNITNKGFVSRYGFADKISSIYGSGNITPIEIYPTIAKRPSFSGLINNKFEMTFNYELPNWVDSLNEIYGKR